MGKWFLIAGIVLTVGGAIATVWSVLCTKGKYVGTADWHDKQTELFEKQKKQVCIGTIFVLAGGVLQVIGTILG